MLARLRNAVEHIGGAYGPALLIAIEQRAGHVLRLTVTLQDDLARRAARLQRVVRGRGGPVAGS